MMPNLVSNSRTIALDTQRVLKEDQHFDGMFNVKLHTTGKRIIWALAVPIILWLAFVCFYFIAKAAQLALIWKIILGLLGLGLIGPAILGIKLAHKRSGIYFRGIRFIGNRVQIGSIVVPCSGLKDLEEDGQFNLENPEWAVSRTKIVKPIKFLITICAKKKGSNFFIRKINVSSRAEPPVRIINNSTFSFGKFCIIRNNKVHLFSQSNNYGLNETLLEQLGIIGVLLETSGLNNKAGLTLKIKSPWNSRIEASTAAFLSLWDAYSLANSNNLSNDQRCLKTRLIDDGFDRKFFALIDWFRWQVKIF